MAGWALAAVLLGGCGGRPLELGAGTAAFQRVVLESDRPVLVDFWKFGCASCAMVDPIMAQLAEEYSGRVVVARFMMMNFFLWATNREIYDRYDFAFFPTVILFVNGQERKRWVWNCDINAYRKVLDELVGPPGTQPDSPAPARPPDRPGKVPAGTGKPPDKQ